MAPERARVRALRGRLQVVGRHRLPLPRGPRAAPVRVQVDCRAPPRRDHRRAAWWVIGLLPPRPRARDAGPPGAAEGDPQDGVLGRHGERPPRPRQLEAHRPLQPGDRHLPADQEGPPS
jgi:hypothetical protein